jgi:hypothetical protein
MTINFSELIPTEQKQAMLEQRIAQLALEGYQHQLNLQAAETAKNDEIIEASNVSIAIITTAIETAQKELDGLK